jgi:predicted nucleic acid-binding protein
MVAALCAWHERHEWIIQQLDQRLDAGERLVVAAPALVETYAVLTRLPPPHRLSPIITRSLLEANLLDHASELVALDAESYRRLIGSAPDRDIAGGRVYDAVIVTCAQSAGVDALLTLNGRHFSSLIELGMGIVVPG